MDKSSKLAALDQLLSKASAGGSKPEMDESAGDASCSKCGAPCPSCAGDDAQEDTTDEAGMA